MLGATAATFGAYLGGHLLARRGVGVDHTAFDAGPSDWTPTLPETDLGTEPVRVVPGGVAVMLLRRGHRIVALPATCPHRGGPLDEGRFDADSVTCPWHGSCFALDGALRRGPATAPLRPYEARVNDGVVEVRAPIS
jgi:nitrite reductase/ring-hydroxylating ferredoxin subunit